MSLDDKCFENKLKKSISSGSTVLLNTSLLHLYKQNPNPNNKLMKFYGNLYVRNTHHISVTIDTEIWIDQPCKSFNHLDESS